MSTTLTMGENKETKKRLQDFYNNNHRTFIKQVKEEVNYQNPSSSIQPISF